MSRAWRRPRVWQGTWALMIAAVVVGSLLPASELPAPRFAHFDKVEHFGGYFVLSAYAAMLFERGRPLLRAAVALIALGVLIELAQGAFTATRAADPLDAVVNTLGVGVGSLLARTPARGLLRWLDHRLFRSRLAPL